MGKAATVPKRNRFCAIKAASWFFTSLAFVAVTAGLILLLVESIPVWRHSGLEFITGRNWFYRAREFGALPMIYGSLQVAVIAILIAAPIGVGAAIFGTEFLSGRLRIGLKIVIELLAGIPSVIYGLLGILLLRNWVYDSMESLDILSGDTLLTAGILLAVMILPTIMTLADDALQSVPRAQRMAARSLGLTATETAINISLRGAYPGLIAAVLLAMGRALGETIAVFLVVGRQDNQLPESLFSFQPLVESGQTLTSKLGGSETNIAYGEPLHWGAMLGLGILLMAMVTGLTLAGLGLQNLARRKNET